MLIFILLIAHFISDFTFQTADLAEKKIKSFRYLVIHTLIYAGIFSIAIFPFVRFRRAIFFYLTIVLSHFFVDWIRKTVENRNFNNKTVRFVSFIMDQALHISNLVFCYFLFDLNTAVNIVYSNIQNWPYFNKLIVCTLIFVIIWDPAAVFIKKLFAYIFDADIYANEANDQQIGRVIGKLERLIISVLVLCNQFGAVGFVLAAKSIARYKQLEDKNFAEKYLVGTLTSASIAFITTIILGRLI